MLIGQTSRRCARRRMLSASMPSSPTACFAAARTRSRDRSPRCATVRCIVRCTARRTLGGVMSSSTKRKLAWFAIAGQVVFVVAWIVAGALEDGYSQVDQGVSELGADGAANPLLANAALVVLGAAIAAVGLALRRMRLATVLFVCAGGAFVVAGVVPLDCGLSHDSCERMWHAGELTWRTDVHLWAAFAAEVSLALTPFALARALWPGPVAPLAFGAGVFGVALGIAQFAIDS